MKKGVVDAFLGVGGIAQNVAGYTAAIAAELVRERCDGFLRTVEK